MYKEPLFNQDCIQQQIKGVLFKAGRRNKNLLLFSGDSVFVVALNELCSDLLEVYLGGYSEKRIVEGLNVVLLLRIDVV